MTQEEKIKEKNSRDPISGELDIWDVVIKMRNQDETVITASKILKEWHTTELNRRMEEVLKELNIEYSKLNLIMSQYTFDSDMKHSVKTGYGWAIDKVKSLLNDKKEDE